jgi:type I restriction enzyme S subunit
MSDDLPMGWELVGFPEVVFFQEGPGLRKYQYRKSGVPFLNIRTFVDERIDKKLCNYLDLEEVEQKYKHFLVDANDILVATSGSIGKMAIAKSQDLPLMLNTSIMRFRPITEEKLERGFLYFFLKSDHFFMQAESAWTGTAQKNMGPSHVKTFSILLPPLNEQRRIVDKLERIGDRHRTARNELSHIPKLIARYKQAVLAAACSGKLTEDWREKRKTSMDSWETKLGSDVFFVITSGSRGWAKYYSDSGAIFLRVGNLDHLTIDLDLEEIQYVCPPDGAEGQRTKIEIGDILISITADVGMIALIREDIGEAYINQHLCLARQTGDYYGEYLAYYLSSPSGGLAQLGEAQRGVTKAGLTLGDIRQLNILVPPLEEQKEIVWRVEKMFEKIDMMEQEYQKAAKLCDRLEQATLAKAFRGELVPQDPDDEPASVLLEQVKREKEKGKIKTKK